MAVLFRVEPKLIKQNPVRNQRIETRLGRLWKKISFRKFNAQSELKRLSDILNDSSAEVSSNSHQMIPKTLNDAGLEVAISDRLGSVFKITGIRYNLNTYEINSRIDKTIEITVFRVCQELINNIIKYAGATTINIQLYQSQ